MSPSLLQRGQSSMISIVIIAGIIIALVGAAYVWAVPMIEKRMTVTDYNQVESFMLELDDRILDIANSGSGEASVRIPKGLVTVKGSDTGGPDANTITIEFHVSQPIMTSGSVPIKTTSMGDVGDFGKAEPRVLMLSRAPGDDNRVLNITMKYRELRSSTPKGYIIAVCPSNGCGSVQSGTGEVLVRYDRTVIENRVPEEGDLTKSIVTLTVN